MRRQERRRALAIAQGTLLTAARLSGTQPRMRRSASVSSAALALRGRTGDIHAGTRSSPAAEIVDVNRPSSEGRCRLSSTRNCSRACLRVPTGRLTQPALFDDMLTSHLIGRPAATDRRTAASAEHACRHKRETQWIIYLCFNKTCLVVSQITELNSCRYHRSSQRRGV